MLGIKDFEDHLDAILVSMKNRGRDTQDVMDLVALIKEKAALIKKVDTLRTQRNQISSQHRGNIQDSDIIEKIRQLKSSLEESESLLDQKSQQVDKIMYGLPNILDTSVPIGASENDNVEVSRWGEPRKFDFTVLSHDEIGKNLDILDLERGVKLSGSRFFVLKKKGALLERALSQFFLDRAHQAGYTEFFTPFIVKDQTMFYTGQLPKFQEDLFKIDGEDKYLIPTAEVTLTALHANEILKESELPKHFCAFTSCFRKEAGSYGKDTRGIFRVHQFQKVELVHYSHPDHSMEELEQMVHHAESLLKALELPYRQILLSSGDTGFSSKKTYDLEVYLPFEQRYREVSSCSNCGDFQARRGNIKYKDQQGKNQYIHTLNGSGLAVGRIWVAILENYQNADGTVHIPTVLQPYMYNLTKIEREKS